MEDNLKNICPKEDRRRGIQVVDKLWNRAKAKWWKLSKSDKGNENNII